MEFLFVSRYSLVNLILHPYCGRFKKEGKKERGKKKTSILPHFCREGMIFINLREMGQCYRESLERVNRCRSHKGYDLFQERRIFIHTFLARECINLTRKSLRRRKNSRRFSSSTRRLVFLSNRRNEVFFLSFFLFQWNTGESIFPPRVPIFSYIRSIPPPRDGY